MQIQENISLRPYNSFGIDVKGRFFSSFNSAEELPDLFHAASSPGSSYHSRQFMILGGGSNVLFTKDFDGLVLKNEISGIDIVKEDEEYVYLKVGAGENWHQFVIYCVNHNWGGAENLSLIPGNVGASPMQNIGAYGVEIRDLFHELNAFHIQEQKIHSFSLNDCQFGYRESIFKRKYKGQYIILDVTYRLRKHPVFNTSYGALEKELEQMGTKELSIRAISQAVINIRSSKLPDPTQIGNAGSFFKNPSVSHFRYEELKAKFPALIAYPNEDGSYKLAAGWLIEACGWKGFREGDAGVHAKQALVLVNYKNATGQEIYELSTRIIDSVKGRFSVELEREVNIF